MSYQVESYEYLNSAHLFSKVASQPWAMYLDSGVITKGGEVFDHGEYDILAIKPRTTLVTQGGFTTITRSKGDHEQSLLDPLELLRKQINDLSEPDGSRGLPDQTQRYLPGAFGYFAYDLARRFEQLDDHAINDEYLPEMAMGIYDVIVLVDHRKKLTQLVIRDLECGTQASLEIEAIQAEWQNLIEEVLSDQNNAQAGSMCTALTNADRLKSRPIVENMDKLEYSQSFNRIREYTIEGDCYQVNFAKRFTSNVTGDAWQTYSQLRSSSPAPYGAYFNLPFAQVLSNSPESFIQCRDRKVITSPIKGTMPRDHTDRVNDQLIAQQLLKSPKDRAENLMIVDLMRNDLSRCCELGSVKVPTLFALHSFANVHHLISTITGILKKSLHCLDLFRSCFPGGSITGAPKIRAMQIIEELEPHRRGLYCGSIAYVGMDGSLETNIAIRTMVVKDGVARYSAGGGLVIDSDIDAEYQEIFDKARMMTESLSD